MNTRSQTKYDKAALYEVDLDFDAASEAWKQNKISIGNGQYKYKPIVTRCTATLKPKIDSNSEKQCRRNCMLNSAYCTQHTSLKLTN